MKTGIKSISTLTIIQIKRGTPIKSEVIRSNGKQRNK